MFFVTEIHKLHPFEGGWGHGFSGRVGAGVGVCGRVWGHVAGVNVCGRGSGLYHGQGHVAGVGTCGRIWGHVGRCRGMWQGWCQAVGACGRGRGMW